MKPEDDPDMKCTWAFEGSAGSTITMVGNGPDGKGEEGMKDVKYCFKA